ncbi:MAG TPA: hypothetical protein VK821_05105 [Dehalococcoidia bacterium]|nr:hypothetical protein [Dehalococcoidia bacterium]
MTRLDLSFAITPYDRVQPLLSGEVRLEGIRLRYFDLNAPDVFVRQIKWSQFDVSEMSFSSFLRARSQGWPYRALPVFHNRNFSYTRILIRRSSGIRPNHPEDLKGKHVGIADYQQTAGLWQRGVLEHEFGVAPGDMEWFQERPPELSHTGTTGFDVPAGVKFHYTDTDLGTMFLRGDLDAAFTYITGTAIDRDKADLSRNPDYCLLFDDPRAESCRYYQKEGVFPPHHLTVVRESILQEHPWVSLDLMNAFEKAKKLAMDRLRVRTPSLLIFSREDLEQQRSVFGDDPFAYGVKANAKAIDMVQTFSVEQGFTPKKQPLDELFPREILTYEGRL